jgi:hypothetical protein
VRATRTLLLASIGAMLLFAFLLGQALGLPEVEDPIPDRIGLQDVFVLAGAGGVLGGIAGLGLPSAQQEQGVKWGTFLGFCCGVAMYCLSLLIQLLSAL